MSSSFTLAKDIPKILILDVLAVVAVFLLPSLSHFFPFPLYFIEPMRLAALSVYFLSRYKLNAYLLALALPIFSMLYSGHPIPLKAVLISIELVANLLILNFLLGKFPQVKVIPLFLSIILSKLLYYSLKYAFLTMGILKGSLVSIPIYIQLIIAAVTSIVFFAIIAGTKRLSS